MRHHYLPLILVLVFLSGCQPLAPLESAAPATIPRATVAVIIEPLGTIQPIHDPVMAQEDGTYYVFSTGGRIPVYCSQDMIEWEFCTRVFLRNPSWTRAINPNLSDIWAPDISYFNDRWHLYYAVSTFGSQESAIGLATNVTLDPAAADYAWSDHGLVLQSRPGDPWNAIDANLVLDQTGEPWLAWGSYWHGIWLAKVDKSTGLISDDPSSYHNLADRTAGGSTAIEAPFIVPHGGEWFLFASFDQCCQGSNSTYNVRVGRSDSLTGPYMDRDGRLLTEGGGTLLLDAYGQWKGPGHNGVYVEDGAEWFVYHAYDSQQNGIPKLRIESIAWDADGWPTLPSQLAEE